MSPPAGYESWDEPGAAPSARDGYEAYTPPSETPRDWLDLTGGAAKTGAYGAGAGAGAFFLRGLLRKAFPGTFPKTSALKRIDEAIRKSESSSSLKRKFSEYMREVSATNKPLTFADFMAQQPGHATANAALKEMIANSGNVPAIDEKLADRAAGAKDRVLNDIAGALGVPKQSVVMGKDALIEQRKTKAQPLYDQAFADDRPIKDQKFFGLFEAPAARKALGEAVTNAENRLKPMDVRSAANPRRKDWWKFASQEDVPEGMFIDEEGANGLRRYIAPNMRNADAIQKALRSMMESKMLTDPTTGYQKHTEASRALDELHKNFMQTMYEVAPNDAYREARTTYAGESKLLEAHKIGAELLTMKPDEVRKAIKGMGTDQREALAQGFYGSMNDMAHQKFLRELVARPERYPERREVLSAVFQDPIKLEQFMANLRGEEGMADSAAIFGNAPPSKDPGPRLPWLRVTDSPIQSGDMTAKIVAHMSPHLGWPSSRASRKGTDFAFREPTFGRRSVSHPDWGDVEGTPLSPLEIFKKGAQWTGTGGLGGLGTYGLSQIPRPAPDPSMPELTQ